MRVIRSFLMRRRWRRLIGGFWHARSPEFGPVELQLALGPGDSLRVIRAANCPFFAIGDDAVGFPSVPIIADASFYRNFTRLEAGHLWIDVCSRSLGWKVAKPFEFAPSQPPDPPAAGAARPAPLRPTSPLVRSAAAALPPCEV